MSGALCAILEVIARGRVERLICQELGANAIVVLLYLGVDGFVGILRCINKSGCHVLHVVTSAQVGDNKDTLEFHETLGVVKIVVAEVVLVEHRHCNSLLRDKLAGFVAYNWDGLELSVYAVKTVGRLRDTSNLLKMNTRLALVFCDGARMLLAKMGKDFSKDFVDSKKGHCVEQQATMCRRRLQFFPMPQ